MDADAYGRVLKRLLPRGPLWNLNPDSVLSRLLAASGEELARVEARGLDFINETDPRTALETLEDWERALGLPDEDVTEIPATTEARRTAIVQKLIRLGGQSRAYFEAVAVACGHSITILDNFGLTVARAGRARAGDLARGVQWAHYWEVQIAPDPPPEALTTEELKRVLQRIAPAHTVVYFDVL